MACSKPIPDALKKANSLIICSICLEEMENPKALPCLHSFCLECIKKVANRPGRFICPLCQEEIPLPAEGADGFRDNFFINQLKARKSINSIDSNVPCSCCRSAHREIQARCLECDGFLCQQCVDMHDTLTPLRAHNIFTLQELRSGKVDVTKAMKEECCRKHKDQVLRWFCKTCGISICRDCTVMEHTRPQHDYDSIETVTEGQIEEITMLVANCHGISRMIDDAIENTQRVKSDLKKSTDEAKKQLDDAKDETQRALVEALERNYEANSRKLAGILTKHCDKINSTTKSLQNFKSKLNNAMEVADQIISSGSKHAVASNYSTLHKTLTQLKETKPTGITINKSLGVVTFRPSENGMACVDLGTISAKLESKERHGRWVLEKVIGKDEPGRIQGGVGVTVQQTTSDIFIADCIFRDVKVFDANGKYKRSLLQGRVKNPHDVAVSSNGFHFVTDRSAFVKVYHPDGRYLKQFQTKPPFGRGDPSSELYGITRDKDGNILVGSSKMYISKHRPDGAHISSFRTYIHPWSIAVTSEDQIAVCANTNEKGVNILDHTGNLLRIIIVPHSIKTWRPCGVCCSDDGIIYVTSYDAGGGYQTGVYSFTADGEYLACVTTDVTYAEGISLIDNDRLVVTQYNGHPAKIFRYVLRAGSYSSGPIRPRIKKFNSVPSL